MPSHFIKLLLFAALLVCLHFTLALLPPESTDAALTPMPQQEQQRIKQAAILHHNLVSSSLADYVDACIINDEKPLAEHPEDYSMEGLREENRFFDVMSESTGQAERKLKKLVSYYRKHSEEKLVALEIIRVCTATPELAQCHPALLNTLTLPTSDAEPWIYLASFHAARGNRERVIEAMSKAIQSDFYGNGYAERVSRLSDIISQNTPEGLYNAVVAAIGIEASNSVFPKDVFLFCKEASSDLYIATLCHQLGQDMVLRGKTLAFSSAGQSLINMMREGSEFHFPANTTASSDAYDAGDMQTIWPVMQYNDRLLLNWLTDLQVLGEKKAAREAIESVRALAMSDDFTHCAE